MVQSKSASVAKGSAPRSVASGRARSSRKVARKAEIGRGYGSRAVYDRLRKEILSLELAPGTLLDETEIAERFQLSRSPVREALVRLSAEGLVVTLRNRSSIVAPFDIATVPAYIDATRLLYRLTSRLAALNRTGAQLERIRTLQETHLAASADGNLEQLISLNREFHVAIAEASGNSFIAQWTRMLMDQGQRIMATYLHDLECRIPDGTLDEHARLVEAIENRDGDAAELAGARDADILSEQLRQRLHARSAVDFTIQSDADLSRDLRRRP